MIEPNPALAAAAGFDASGASESQPATATQQPEARASQPAQAGGGSDLLSALLDEDGLTPVGGGATAPATAETKGPSRINQWRESRAKKKAAQLANNTQAEAGLGQGKGKETKPGKQLGKEDQDFLLNCFNLETKREVELVYEALTRGAQPTKHIIGPNENYVSIAQHYGLTEDELRKANGVHKSQLRGDGQSGPTAGGGYQEVTYSAGLRAKVDMVPGTEIVVPAHRLNSAVLKRVVESKNRLDALWNKLTAKGVQSDPNKASSQEVGQLNRLLEIFSDPGNENELDFSATPEVLARIELQLANLTQPTKQLLGGITLGALVGFGATVLTAKVPELQPVVQVGRFLAGSSAILTGGVASGLLLVSKIPGINQSDVGRWAFLMGNKNLELRNKLGGAKWGTFIYGFSAGLLGGSLTGGWANEHVFQPAHFENILEHATVVSVADGVYGSSLAIDTTGDGNPDFFVQPDSSGNAQIFDANHELVFQDDSGKLTDKVSELVAGGVVPPGGEPQPPTGPTQEPTTQPTPDPTDVVPATPEPTATTEATAEPTPDPTDVVPATPEPTATEASMTVINPWTNEEIDLSNLVKGAQITASLDSVIFFDVDGDGEADYYLNKNGGLGEIVFKNNGSVSRGIANNLDISAIGDLTDLVRSFEFQDKIPDFVLQAAESQGIDVDSLFVESSPTTTSTATSTATPTATTEATSTATSEPTPTGTAAHTATPTATAEPTPTATPTAESTHTATATPTATPEPTPTATPTATPESTAEPTPPAGVEAPLTFDPETNTATNAEGQTVYQVQSGDWVERIAQSHGITPEALREANPELQTSGHVIHPGDRLVIPEPTEATPPPAGVEAPLTFDPETNTATNAEGQTVYQVQPGDWVEKIAVENGVSPEALREANPELQTSGHVIHPGDRLVIPEPTEATPPPAGVEAPLTFDPETNTATNAEGQTVYQVQPGDWVEKIAVENGVSPEALREANPELQTSGHVIHPGDRLVIPEPTEATPPTTGTETTAASVSGGKADAPSEGEADADKTASETTATAPEESAPQSAWSHASSAVEAFQEQSGLLGREVGVTDFLKDYLAAEFGEKSVETLPQDQVFNLIRSADVALTELTSNVVPPGPTSEQLARISQATPFEQLVARLNLNTMLGGILWNDLTPGDLSLIEQVSQAGLDPKSDTYQQELAKLTVSGASSLDKYK